MTRKKIKIEHINFNTEVMIFNKINKDGKYSGKIYVDRDKVIEQFFKLYIN